MVGVLAGALEAVESGEGAVELALEGGFVAREGEGGLQGGEAGLGAPDLGFGLLLLVGLGELAAVGFGAGLDLVVGDLEPVVVVAGEEIAELVGGIQDLGRLGQVLEEGGCGGLADAEGGVQAIIGGELGAGGGLAAGDGAGFGAEEAAEAPVGRGDALDEDLFDDGGGGEVLAELSEEGVELGAGLVGLEAGGDEGAGEDAVLEGVPAGAGFAGGGAGAGGFEGIAAVGGELVFGGHGAPEGVVNSEQYSVGTGQEMAKGGIEHMLYPYFSIWIAPALCAMGWESFDRINTDECKSQICHAAGEKLSSCGPSPTRRCAGGNILLGPREGRSPQG
jgi:hypothetical protein